VEVEDRDVGLGLSTFAVPFAMFIETRWRFESFASVSAITSATWCCHPIVIPPK